MHSKAVEVLLFSLPALLTQNSKTLTLLWTGSILLHILSYCPLLATINQELLLHRKQIRGVGVIEEVGVSVS